MADDNSDARAYEPPGPNPALGSLEVMVGTWELRGRESGPEGEIHGRPTFEWMEGGFYLVQHVDIDHIGRRIVGTEYIGYDRSEEHTSELQSRQYLVCRLLLEKKSRHPHSPHNATACTLARSPLAT